MSSHNGFLLHGREDAKRRPVSERLRDWQEVYEAPKAARMATQAERCMDCGVPFCQGPTGCPLHNLIPEWNELVTQGRWHEALERLHATNNFPEFTGRLCPAPCETACTLGLHSSAVTIKTIEQTIIDMSFERGWVKPQPATQKSGRRVAVIGSGPAGLAAAQELARKGHDVTVFEKAPRIGGLLRYGIPDFKMEKSLIDRRLAQLEAEGVRFQPSTCVGTDISFEQLREEFDAICLAIGAEQPRELSIAGRDLEGVCLAMDFLSHQNCVISGDEPGPSALSAEGKNVIILGGGDTGSDCLGTALRQGAKSVQQFEIMPEPPPSRSPQTPWPYWAHMLRSSHAHEEGGTRHWSISTNSFVAKDGRVAQLVAEKVEMKDGRFNSVPDSTTTFDVDLVILAMGFTGPRLAPLLEGLGLDRDPRGNIKTGGDFMTSQKGVFAAGDARRGASLIVWAIAEGRQMATAVHRFLEHSPK
jgi:glutamate synthase (NADPH/NADH) small chain